MTKFTDTAGTTPAGYGDSVARLSDLKAINGGGRPALQSNVALSPIHGRMPLSKRRNVLVNTGNIDAYGQSSSQAPNWRVLDGTSVEKTGATFRGCPVYRVTPGQFMQTLEFADPETMWCQSLYVKPETVFNVSVSPLFSAHADPPRGASFNLSTEATNEPGYSSITAVEDGWYRVEFSRQVQSGSTNTSGLVRHSFDAPDGWSDPNPPTCLIAGPQLEQVLSEGTHNATPVQHVPNAFDVTEMGAASPAYLRFDLSDDKVTHTFPNGFTGDVMLFGRDGSWIEENMTIPPGGNLDIGSVGVNSEVVSFHKTTPDGGMPGTLDAIGDVVGWLPVGRAMSESERQYMVEYYKERGAKGLLVPGPELIVNHDFSNGHTGWELDNFNQGYVAEVINGRSTITAMNDATHISWHQNFGTDMTHDKTYFWRAKTNFTVNRAALGDMRSGASILRRITHVSDPIQISEGVAKPSRQYSPNLAGVHGFGASYNGAWVDWFSLRELRPEEEW